MRAEFSGRVQYYEGEQYYDEQGQQQYYDGQYGATWRAESLQGHGDRGSQIISCDIRRNRFVRDAD